MSMKKSLSFILIIFGAIMLMNSSNKNGFFPYEFKTETLENGLKVILIKMPSNGLVSYYTIVRTGSRDEYEPGHTGFAHFFEHMMFRGTKKYPGNVYDKILTEMGADGNAYTTDDYTCYHLNFTADNLEKVMDLESDRFQNLWYTEQDFQTESGAVYGEYRKGKASPFFWIWEALCNTAFEKHTYKHTTIGFEEDIKAMPTMYEYSLSFFKRYYRPDNSVLLIVGDIDYDKTFALVKKYYSSWQKGYVPPKIEPEPEQTKEKRKVVIYPGKTAPILAIAYKGMSFNPTDKNYVATILFGRLAFGENSDLFKKLYIREQKVLFLEEEFNFNRDPFLWMIWSQPKDEKDIEYVESEVYKTIEFFQQNLPDAKKLEDLKKNMKYSFLMGLETPGKVASILARPLALSADMKVIDEFYRTLETITPEDISNVAKTYFQPNKRTVVVLKGSK
ncbi:insulinase family protein [Bacteroidetes/Chlorobi group bacterium Naka2016]|nr:MAG: insulinase family protein [Bacteroidetes/Chlorobi group bacterium Naka2016]